jgi:hypothetical protein
MHQRELKLISLVGSINQKNSVEAFTKSNTFFEGKKKTHIGPVQYTRCPVSSLLLWYRAMPLVLKFSLSSTHWASAVHRVPGRHLSLALVPGNAFSLEIFSLQHTLG